MTIIALRRLEEPGPKTPDFHLIILEADAHTNHIYHFRRTLVFSDGGKSATLW